MLDPLGLASKVLLRELWLLNISEMSQSQCLIRGCKEKARLHLCKGHLCSPLRTPIELVHGVQIEPPVWPETKSEEIMLARLSTL